LSVAQYHEMGTLARFRRPQDEAQVLSAPGLEHLEQANSLDTFEQVPPLTFAVLSV